MARDPEKEKNTVEQHGDKSTVSRFVKEQTKKTLREKFGSVQKPNTHGLVYSTSSSVPVTKKEIRKPGINNKNKNYQKTEVKKAPLRAFSPIFGLSILGFLAFFQVVFAVASAVGFGLEASKDALCEGDLISIICSVSGFVLSFAEEITSISFSFQLFGIVFWGLIFLITFVVIFLFGALFFIQRIPFLKETKDQIFLVVAFALNIVPILNIIPFIHIWALYWMFKGLVSHKLHLSHKE